MKQIHRELLIVAICLPLGFCLTYFMLPKHGTRVIDCRIAEISPDIPVNAKQECRKLNAERIK